MPQQGKAVDEPRQEAGESGTSVRAPDGLAVMFPHSLHSCFLLDPEGFPKGSILIVVDSHHRLDQIKPGMYVIIPTAPEALPAGPSAPLALPAPSSPMELGVIVEGAVDAEFVLVAEDPVFLEHPDLAGQVLNTFMLYVDERKAFSRTNIYTLKELGELTRSEFEALKLSKSSTGDIGIWFKARSLKPAWMK